MKIKNCFLVFTVFVFATLSSVSSRAQGKCAPPVALPSTTGTNIFTPEQEGYLGEAIAEHVQKEFRVIEDPELVAYLTQIGEKLIENLPIQTKLQFLLVDAPDANAWVIAGGRIYVTRKLVALAQNEDELAGVIAHELGHLATHESAEDFSRMFKEVLNVTQVTDRRDVFEKYHQLIENVNRKPPKKHDESEKGQLYADQAGLYALAAAGYDPGAMVHIWDRTADTRGRTGSWLSNALGTTKPNERRLREMKTAVTNYPAECVKPGLSGSAEKYKEWQASVIGYSGLGRRETLHGLIRKQQLTPPLLSDITRIKFSLDGKYVLAQDENGISVLTREPFKQLFRIDSEYPKTAQFTPDSQGVVFYNDNLRVEKWSIEEQKRTDVKELRILKGCFQTTLSADGKYLGCLDTSFDLKIYDVGSEQIVFTKKSFYEPGEMQLLTLMWELATRNFESGDAGYHMVNMAFSPNCRYFVAGHSSWVQSVYGHHIEVAEAYDLQKGEKVTLEDSLKKLLAYGFSFAGDDRLVGRNKFSEASTQYVSFPGGAILKEFPLGIAMAEAPTKGNYLIVRPIRNHPLGIVDVETKQIFKSSDRSVIDIYGDLVVSELRNGQLGLYHIDKAEVDSTALVSNSSLGTLKTAEVSKDMKWLAMSSRSRGGVWNLDDGKAAIYLRGFNGAYLDPDGWFFGDFPKYETEERNVARFNLTTGDVTPGPAIANKYSRQMGEYLLSTTSAKANMKENERPDFRKNVKVAMLDVHTMKELWSHVYPREAPVAWVAPELNSMALVWNVKSDAAKEEIQKDPNLVAQSANLREKDGDYFVEFLKARTGESVGKLLLETGKGSFRLKEIYAVGDRVVVTDDENRVLIYSLKTGELKGRVFGGFATISEESNLLCVENEFGKLALYDLDTLEKKDEYVFSNSLAYVRFSEDGKRLFALTRNQTFFVLELAVGKMAASAGH